MYSVVWCPFTEKGVSNFQLDYSKIAQKLPENHPKIVPKNAQKSPQKSQPLHAVLFQAMHSDSNGLIVSNKSDLVFI